MSFGPSAKTTVSLLVLIVLIWHWPGDASANRTLRCGGQLVAVGDTRSEVLDRCDEPNWIERWQVDQDTWVSKYFNYETERYKAPELIRGPIQMERWTYDFGSNRLRHYLLFERDELIRIETGNKAFESNNEPDQMPPR
jgi:hypothetical protein